MKGNENELKKYSHKINKLIKDIEKQDKFQLYSDIKEIINLYPFINTSSFNILRYTRTNDIFYTAKSYEKISSFIERIRMLLVTEKKFLTSSNPPPVNYLIKMKKI